MGHAAIARLPIAALIAWLVAASVATAQQSLPPTLAPQPKGIPRPAAPARPAIAPPPATVPPPAAASPARRTASAEQIATWIRDLDGDEFLVRETAMLQLLEAGPSVLPALKPVLVGGNLESTSRALFVVRQIGLAADIDAKDTAGELLTELAARKETPTLARRAAAALDELIQQRSTQALSELEALGAKVNRSQSIGAFLLDEPTLSIEIGDAFRGDEHDLRRLKWLAHMPILILAGKNVTTGWIKQAALAPGLEEFHLYEAPVDDAALAPLQDHATIRRVGMYYSPVGDAALAPLTKMPLLSQIKLYGTKVTSEAVTQFKKDTSLSVDWKRGAFLGVGGIPVGEACQINTVHEGSPAEKAGLLQQDAIIRFGGKAVSDFSTLMELIAQRDVGEEVEIDVVRRTIDDDGNPTLRRLTAKVKLAPWELDLAVRNPWK